jgi:queuine tRNA-ribosyltransferase
MAGMNAVDDEGVTFKSIVDGSLVRLSPERATEVQNTLGADIIMAFDDCPPSTPSSVADARLTRAVSRDSKKATYDHGARVRLANERTVRWLERCKAAHSRASEQSLFGIVQGGTNESAREWCAERICNIDLPGYAIGGVAVGEPPEEIARIVAHTAPLLPENRPRYLMGVGYERDLLGAVRSGVDMFDCVLPTRNGRNANAFTSRGQVRLRNAKFASDPSPIEVGCDCHACDPARHQMAGPGGDAIPCFSKGYLRHLFMAEEMLGAILVSLHNLRHFQRFMRDVRETISTDDWEGLARRWPVVGGERNEDRA